MSIMSPSPILMISAFAGCLLFATQTLAQGSQDALAQSGGTGLFFCFAVESFSENTLCAPGGTRTPDHLVRSQVLYPSELRAQRPIF